MTAPSRFRPGSSGGGAGTITNSPATQARSITIEAPSTNDDVTWFEAGAEIQISELRAVLTGGGSVTWTIRFGSSRSAAGTEVITGGTATTSITTGDTIIVFTNDTIAAADWVWIEITARSGNALSLSITLNPVQPS